MKLAQTLKEYWALAKLQKEMARYFPGFHEQKEWLDKLKLIDKHVPLAHNSSHILKFLLAILKFQHGLNGCIVEAGAYKGGGTAKISLFARHVNRKLYVFDSFAGLPVNQEAHRKSNSGYLIEGWFQGGNFLGTIDEVKRNVDQYGDLSVCEFIPGWFEDTMPSFTEEIMLAYLDVDLASSTRTCLKYLYPLLQRGGAIYSQDGDFPLVMEVFDDKAFWKNEVGCKEMPVIEGLGEKITIIRKE